jgi:hypothetical protein
MMKFLEVDQNASTLVLIVTLLRQAIKWYHWHSDWDSSGANVSFLEFSSKYPQSLKSEGIEVWKFIMERVNERFKFCHAQNCNCSEFEQDF